MIYGKPPEKNAQNEVIYPKDILVSPEAKEFMRKSLTQVSYLRPELSELKNQKFIKGQTKQFVPRVSQEPYTL